MVKGFCSVCKKEVGTFLKPTGYQCEKCLDIFCMDCAKKVGLIIKKPVCPSCGIELVDSIKGEHLREVKAEEHVKEKEKLKEREAEKRKQKRIKLAKKILFP